jgi:hypothetical protein
MGMDAYALKFKNLVKFDDVKHLFDQCGNFLEWTDCDFRLLDYTNQRIKAWVQTIPGFDESIHTHQFEPNVDYVKTLEAVGKKRLCGSDRNDKRDSGYHPGDDDDKRCPIERKPESIKGCRTGWDKYQPGYTGS